MMRKVLAAALAAALVSNPVLAQLNVSPAQVQNVGPTDLFPDMVGGNPSPYTSYASGLTLMGYGATLPTRGNLLIGGDATTNLFQRATSGASETTTVTYGGPDRWAYWSGTSTAMTVSRDSTAADLPAAGYEYGFKMARTSGQTGVVQACMAQEIESANTYQLQGNTVEVDFHATAGANFSAANGDVTVYVITGTGTDEGMSKLAWGLNAGGGGSTAWAGQANATAAVIPIGTASGRYAAVATIPTTATEAAVAICFTPVGTAGTNDYVALAGIQLVRNATLASSVNTTAGYSCNSASSGAGNPGIQCTAFDRTRNAQMEALLQDRYYWQLNEVTGPAVIAPCGAVTTTDCIAPISFPTTMRIAPTMTYTAGFAAATTTAGGTLGACTTLRTSTVVTSNGPTPNAVAVDCVATTIPAAGSADNLYHDGGSGVIKANAEL